MNINGKKGMSLIEVILTIAILSMIAISLLSGFSSQLINISKGTKVTEEALEAQSIVEDTIFEVKKKIQKSEPLNTVPGWSAQNVQVLGYSIPMQKINLEYPDNENKDTTIYLSSRMAEIEKKNPLTIGSVLIDVSTDPGNKIADLAAIPILTADFADNSIQPSFYGNLFRWWKSDPGKELAQLVFPDDYTLVSVSQDTNVLSSLGTIIGPSRYVVLTVTPVDINGYRGDTVRSTNTVLVKGQEWRVGNFPWIDKNEDEDFGENDVKLNIQTIKIEFDASLPYQNPAEPTITEDITNGSLFVPMKIPPANTLEPGDEYIDITSSEVIDWTIEKNINVAKDFKVSNGTDIKMTSGSKGSEGSIRLYQYIEMDALGNPIVVGGKSKTIDSGVNLETDGDIVFKTIGIGSIELISKSDLKADKILFEPRGDIFVNNSNINTVGNVVFDTTKNLSISPNRKIRITSTEFTTSSINGSIYLTSQGNIEFIGGGWSSDQAVVVPDGQKITFGANIQKVQNRGNLDLGNTGKVEYVNTMQSDLQRSLKLRLDKFGDDKFKITTINYNRNIGYADSSTGTIFNEQNAWKNVGVNNTNLQFTARIISGNGNLNDIEYVFDGVNALSLICKRTTEVMQTRVKIDIRDKYSNNSIVGSGYFNYSVDSSGNSTIEIEESVPVDYYTIIFDTDGGTLISSITALEGSTITAPSNPTKIGYTFAGWDIPIPSVMPGYDRIITGLWTPNSYNVTFNAQGGTPTGNTTVVTYNGTYGLLPTVTKIGSSFLGWFTSSVGGDQVFDNQKYTLATNQTLYAHWTNESYVVTFDSKGGTTPSPSYITATHGGQYGALPVVIRTGYTFRGWYTAESGGSLITSDSYVSIGADHNLFAQWTNDTFTVTFDSNGSNRTPSPTTKQVIYGEQYGTLATISRNRYTFEGWYTADRIRITSSDIVNIEGNHRLYAGWSENSNSCPFVYSYDGIAYNFEHEAIPFSISKVLETTSYGTLSKLREIDGKYHIKIAEMLDEKSFVNGFMLKIVDYPINEGIKEVISDINGNPHTIKNRVSPSTFINSAGDNKLKEVLDPNVFVRSDFDKVKTDNVLESYEASFIRDNKDVDSAKLMVKVQKTLYTTKLGEFYIEKVNSRDNFWWMEKMLSMPIIKNKFIDFMRVINLRVEVWDGEKWIEQGEIRAGLDLLEEFLVSIDLSDINYDGDEIKIRLSSGAGLFEINQISMDFSENVISSVEEVKLIEAKLNKNIGVMDSLSKHNDKDRVKLVQGDEILLEYEVPELDINNSRGFIVGLTGYYYMDKDTVELDEVIEDNEGKTSQVLGSLIERLSVISKEDFKIFSWLTNLMDSTYKETLENKVKFIISEQYDVLKNYIKNR